MITLLENEEIVQVVKQEVGSQNIKFIPTRQEDGTVTWQGYRVNPYNRDQWSLIKWDNAKCLAEMQSRIDAGKLKHSVTLKVGNQTFQLRATVE